MDKDGVRFFPSECTPNSDYLQFGYTCTDVAEAEKIARADARVTELIDGNKYHIVGFDYQDDPTSENNILPLLNLYFFVEGQNRAIGVVVDLESSSVVVAGGSPSS